MAPVLPSCSLVSIPSLNYIPSIERMFPSPSNSTFCPPSISLALRISFLAFFTFSLAARTFDVMTSMPSPCSSIILAISSMIPLLASIFLARSSISKSWRRSWLSLISVKIMLFMRLCCRVSLGSQTNCCSELGIVMLTRESRETILLSFSVFQYKDFILVLAESSWVLSRFCLQLYQISEMEVQSFLRRLNPHSMAFFFAQRSCRVLMWAKESWTF